MVKIKINWIEITKIIFRERMQAVNLSDKNIAN